MYYQTISNDILSSQTRFEEGAFTYDQARTFCEERGGHLAKVTALWQHEEIKSIIPNLSDTNRKNIWIGLNDIEDEVGRDGTRFKAELEFFK